MLQRSAFLLAATAVLAACAEPTTSLPVSSEIALAKGSAPVAPATVRLSYFSPSPVIAMAQNHGFFAAEGLTVTGEQTTSSPTIFRNLRDGQKDVILTQMDNLFNYRYNATNPLGGTFEPVAFGGTDWGNGASLMARPGFTFEDIRGKNVIVDSPNSGFAFVLYGILRNAGLEKGVDYNVVVTGGTPGRYADLVRGTTAAGVPVAATILNAGFQFRAEAAGMAKLGDIKDAASPFMGGSIVALRSWLDANPDVATRFLKAYIRGQDYVLDPANEAEVLQWLTNDANGDVNVATNTYNLLQTRGEGLIPGALIDIAGLYQTASLRASFGGFDTAQNLWWLVSPKSGMYDLDYLKDAHKALKKEAKAARKGAPAPTPTEPPPVISM